MKHTFLLFAACLLVLWVNLTNMYGANSAFFVDGLRPFAGRLLTWWALHALEALGLGLITSASLISAAALVSFAAALRWLAEGVGLSLSTAEAGLAVVGLLPLMLKGSHLYDLPTLALFTLCLGALARRAWWVYGLGFGLASLNRETTILLAVVYALQVGFDYGLLAQVAAFGLIRLMVGSVTADLPGADFAFNWLQHLESFRPNFMLWVVYAFLGAAVAVPVRHRFEHKPRLLRVAALVLVPAVLAIYAVVGWPFEFRVFYEAYPAVALLALPSLPR